MKMQLISDSYDGMVLTAFLAFFDIAYHFPWHESQ